MVVANLGTSLSRLVQAKQAQHLRRIEQNTRPQPQPVTPAEAPPGWYPDPHHLRWWDGYRWTGYVTSR